MAGNENGYGEYCTTRAAEMAAFDRLPLSLRRLLNITVGPWSAEWIANTWPGLCARLGPEGAWRRLIKVIRDGERADTLADYGPTHPEARAL